MSEFAPDRRVLEALWLMICAPGYVNRVSWSPALGDDPGLHYDFEFDQRDEWVRAVVSAGQDRDVRLAAALRSRRGMGTCSLSRVLWARVEGKKEAAALARFRPCPTLVLREGSTSRMVALWELRQALRYEWVLRGNKRISHALFAPKKWSDLEFTFPAPGSCLRAGRARPVPVHVEFFDPAAMFRPRDIVGGLKEAPDPNAWREAVAA